MEMNGSDGSDTVSVQGRHGIMLEWNRISFTAADGPIACPISFISLGITILEFFF